MQTEPNELPVSEEPLEVSPQSEQDENTADAATAEIDPIHSLIEERDQLKSQLLRTAADFDNYRKRSRREIEDAANRAKEDAFREILPIVDNLERAVSMADQAQDAKSIAEGVRMVLKLFEDVSQRLGAVRIESSGVRFDPNLHDAIQQVETSDVEPGTIVAEFAAGFRMGERLVRAALVAVAKKPTVPAEPQVTPEE